MLKELIQVLVEGRHLSEGEMVDAMEAIMGGEATHAQIARRTQAKTRLLCSGDGCGRNIEGKRFIAT